LTAWVGFAKAAMAEGLILDYLKKEGKDAVNLADIRAVLFSN
jgi:hypothetical protein